MTGLVRDTLDELTAALPTISRAACRAAVEARYSEALVVDGYEAVYWRTVARG